MSVSHDDQAVGTADGTEADTAIGTADGTADGTDAAAADGAADGTVDGLADLLVRALRALGDAGRPVQASRLAARAWWALRERAPRQAEHVNGVMHYLARLPAEPDHRKGIPMSEQHADPTLDVRSEPPARRHKLIFESYTALHPGTGFELVNDHDPKPLYYQFEAEHSGQFSWDYLEQGPEVWRVRIGRPAS